MSNVGLGRGEHLLPSSITQAPQKTLKVILKQPRSLSMIIMVLLLLLFSPCHSLRILEQWLTLVVWRSRVSTAGAVGRASNTAGRDLLTQVERDMPTVDHFLLCEEHSIIVALARAYF